ncbi:helix-turn-helix domain-containing protein [Latilactobacillus graminis]|uniref:Mga helix-turn-helix domain-containing protein n=2 Tax=Latilactobacillus graminis TaxID=60519 RepID=A0AA89KWQ5_9LACO|nr:helix-turn-helix domain-containing protein [Latilactobacillus graminis]KRM21207.1 hypothetical protein FC90_GL001744 [Latilactobacillus graminis DSM 20719]QFP79333.1 helix-turn-helix domain-containing protein [Latilactobacillus graminis]
MKESILLFLESKDARKFHLLKHLLEIGNEWQDGRVLATEIGCSIKTLPAIVTSLNQDLAAIYQPQEATIEHRQPGYRLTSGLISEQSLLINYLEQSIAFDFIKTLFEENQLSTVEYCLNHYLSLATLTRKLNRIKPYLIKFQLALNISQAKLIGPEKQLRHFFYHFFYDTYRDVKWPFSKLRQQTIVDEVFKIDQALKSRVNPVELVGAAYYNAVFQN